MSRQGAGFGTRSILSVFLSVAALFVVWPGGTPLHAEAFSLGAEDAAGPWGMSDGGGCGNDLVMAAFAAAGERASLQILPYARAKNLTMSGKIAGCFGMSWLPEFKGQIVFAERPLYVTTSTLMVRAGAGRVPRGPADIEPGSVVGIVIDYEYPSGVMDLESRGVKFESVESEEMLLKMLASGRIDFAVINLDSLKDAEFVARAAGVEGRVRSAYAIASMGTYVGFSLSNPRGLEAKAAFDRGFAIIVENGTYAAKIAQWRAKLQGGGY